MNKKISKQLDEVLRFLDTTKAPFCNWIDLLNHLKFNTDNEKILFSILNSKNYITYTNFIGGAKSVEINDNGRTFIHNSSFLRERKYDKIKQVKSNTALTIDIISKILSICGVVVSIYLGFLNYNKNIVIERLEKENTKFHITVDSLEIIISDIKKSELNEK